MIGSIAQVKDIWHMRIVNNIPLNLDNNKTEAIRESHDSRCPQITEKKCNQYQERKLEAIYFMSFDSY